MTVSVNFITLYVGGVPVQVVEGSQLHFIYAGLGATTQPPTAIPYVRPDPFPQYVHDEEIASLLADAAVAATDPVVAALLANSGSQTAAAARDALPPTTDAGALTSGTLADERLPARLAEDELRAAFGTPVALAKLHAGLATREIAPCRIGFAGSSTTEGNNATDASHRYVNLLVGMLQAAYPSGTGSETSVVASNSANFGTLTTQPGVHGYNAGDGGTTAATYLTSGELDSIAALNPRAVFHMIGANDFKNGVTVATYKANVQAAIDDLKASISGPCVHILVHTYARWDAFTPVAPWSAYGAALREIAAADPENVAFIDISAAYELVDVPGSDPLNLVSGDNVHQTNAGHAFMAYQLRQALNVAQAAAPPPAPPTPLTINAMPGDGQVIITRSGGEGLDVTYALYRGTTPTGTPIATSFPFTDTGRANDIAVSYVATATNAVGVTTSDVVTVTPSAAAALISDSFDRADGAIGVADTGQAWAADGGTYTITSGRVAGTGGVALIDVGTTDIDVSVDVIYAGGVPGMGVVFNASDVNNRLTFYIDAAGAPRLAKTDGGTLTNLATGTTVAITSGTTHRLRAVSVGATITCYVNGVQDAQHTLSAGDQTKFKALTKVGLRQSGPTAASFDNFLADLP